MLTCGSPWLFAAYRVLHRQSVPWHPPCALVRLIFAVILTLLRPQASITTVFTLPISTASDWIRPLLQLKARFVFPTFSLCSFQGAITGLRDPLSRLSSRPSRTSSSLEIHSAFASLLSVRLPSNLEVSSIFSMADPSKRYSVSLVSKRQIVSAPLQSFSTASAFTSAAPLRYLHRSFLTSFSFVSSAYSSMLDLGFGSHFCACHFSLERR